MLYCIRRIKVEVPKIKKILLYEISRTKLQLPPEPLTRGLPTPDPRSLCPLSSTEFVEPPTQTKFLGTPFLSSARHPDDGSTHTSWNMLQ